MLKSVRMQDRPLQMSTGQSLNAKKKQLHPWKTSSQDCTKAKRPPTVIDLEESDHGEQLGTDGTLREAMLPAAESDDTCRTPEVSSIRIWAEALIESPASHCCWTC
jgi:hypothetical protein